ncbi:MAG: sulfatase-like hydrolase/transferase, partial [Gemmatimonadetes bacterium]|nr:sulfatase-like hydrolase/transferase [Gemmatimonadota bacterium]
MLSVTEAGPYDRSLEWDYDEDVGYQAVRWLYDHARGSDERPFMLTVSFIQPHDPYLAPREDWARYDHAAIDMPTVPYIPPAERDPLSRRMYELYDRDEYRVTDEDVRNARHGYYAMITYVDRKFGELLAALKTTGLVDDTIVIATADHGDMLGERGLWYKMNFFERSARVPLIVHAPRLFGSRRVPQNVSLVDLLPTFHELASDGGSFTPATPVDGDSLVGLASGSADGWPDLVCGEYMAEGTFQPVFMMRRGSHKYISCAGDPPQLFDIGRDPHELTNLAGDANHAKLAAAFAQETATRWNSAHIREQVVHSQRQRLFVQAALLKGRIHPWDYEPRTDAARQYNR